MAQRVGSDDLTLVVTAINVQYEMGGNLALVLESISQTVRERIKGMLFGQKPSSHDAEPEPHA